MGEIIIALARAMWQICTLRRGPQDLPASSMLMVLMLLLNAVASATLETIEIPATSAVMAAVIDAVVVVILIRVLLQATGRHNRFLQTVTAIAGTGLVLSFFALPVVAWLAASVERRQDIGIPMLLWLAVFGWNLLVIAHVLRHAIDSNLVVGFVLAVAIVFIDIQLINHLVPTANPSL